MTKLRSGKTVIRETQVFDHRRAIVVALYPAHLALRLKATRKEYALPYDNARSRSRRSASRLHANHNSVARKREAVLRRGS